MFESDFCSSVLMEETHSQGVQRKAEIARPVHQADDDQRSGRVYRQILVALKGREVDRARSGSCPDSGCTDEDSDEDSDDFSIGGYAYETNGNVQNEKVTFR